MRSTHILFLFITLHPNCTDLNSYSYTLSEHFLGAFLGIAFISTAVNKYFGDVLGEVNNNSNTVIIYLFFHAGTKSSKGRIFFITLALIKLLEVLCGIVISDW